MRALPQVLLMAGLLASAVCAADKADKREQAEAKAEEEAEASLGENGAPGFSSAGRLALEPANGNAEVVGTFHTDTAQYQLKLADPALLQLLKKHDRKTVTLTGALRNKGKYLVVSGVIEPAAPGVVRKKKAGL